MPAKTKDQVLQECIDRGKATLSDHLTESGYIDDFNARKSIETQVVRAITEDDRYKPLRGSVICPSQNTRAAWADGVERLDDKHPRPRFTTSLVLSREVDPVLNKHTADWRYQGERGTMVAVRDAVAAVATSSKRKQDAISNVIVRQNDELDYALEVSDRKTEDINSLREERDYLRQALTTANEHIAKLVDRLGGPGSAAVAV